jgi:hypothetical protein
MFCPQLLPGLVAGRRFAGKASGYDDAKTAAAIFSLEYQRHCLSAFRPTRWQIGTRFFRNGTRRGCHASISFGQPGRACAWKCPKCKVPPRHWIVPGSRWTVSRGDPANATTGETKACPASRSLRRPGESGLAKK